MHYLPSNGDYKGWDIEQPPMLIGWRWAPSHKAWCWETGIKLTILLVVSNRTSPVFGDSLRSQMFTCKYVKCLISNAQCFMSNQCTWFRPYVQCLMVNWLFVLVHVNVLFNWDVQCLCSMTYYSNYSLIPMLFMLVPRKAFNILW